jgi:SAM-dependent methyltransferase
MIGSARQTLCRICGDASDHVVHLAREMMFGTRATYEYFACSACGCLQALDPPRDLGSFYPDEYVSFRARDSGLKGTLKRLRAYSYFGRDLGLGRWIVHRYPDRDLAAMARLRFPKTWNILDVGSGNGRLLLELHAVRYRRLTGLDPFIREQISYSNGVRILKNVLSRLDESGWDLIMFHDSLEHVPDQVETLSAAAQRLAPGGRCLVRVPMLGWAWEHYGTDWVVLDPPRHLFLHTERSLGLLAARCGLRVLSVEYDSDEFQFWASELYRRSIPLATAGVPRRFFSGRQLRDFRRRSRELNASHRGDTAAFLLAV